MANSAVRRLIVALPVVLVVAGCGTVRSADSPATTTSDPAPTTTTTTTETTTTTTTPTPAPFTAVDDRNLAACGDGVCEVFVQSGDALPSAVGPVQITVEGGMITLSQVSASGFASTLSGPPGSTQQINDQVFFIAAVQDGQGVLRLTVG